MLEGDVVTEKTDAVRVGPTLRALRIRAGYTLEAVAQHVELSTSFLSMLENEKTDVSLGRLQRLAKFYGISVSDLFVSAEAELRGPQRVVRFSDARRFVSPDDGVIERLLSADPSRHMEPWHVIMEPGARFSEPISHAGEEFNYVLQGHLRVTFPGDEVYDLYEGDTIYHPGDLPHIYENAGEGRLVYIGCGEHIPSQLPHDLERE